MIRSLVSASVAGLIGYAVTRTVLTSRLRGHQRVLRTNHAGDEVSLIEGPAVSAGLIAGQVLIEDPRQRAAALLATTVAGGLGAVDDFMESGSSKGLRGHLGALAHGEITTGAIKVIGIPVASVLAAAILGSGEARRPTAVGAVFSRSEDTPHALTRIVDAIISGGVIAGSANLFNLLDLRPGRALKAGLISVFFLVDGPRATWVPLTGLLGAAIAAWPEDLAGKVMLGDAGANALGAALGTTLVAESGRGTRITALAVLAGLTLLSEKVSFTRVIESTPGLRDIDSFGRLG